MLLHSKRPIKEVILRDTGTSKIHEGEMEDLKCFALKVIA